MIYEKLFADPKNRKKIHCCAMQWTASYTKELNFRFYFYRNRKPCELLQRVPYVVSTLGNTIMQTQKPKLNQCDFNTILKINYRKYFIVSRDLKIDWAFFVVVKYQNR